MIERYQLRYFLAVVEHGSFSRAAAHCNVAQPTLSAGIAKLERGLGSALFIRNSKRVQMTPTGVHFLEHAQRIENDFNLALQAMTRKSPSGTVRLGVLKSIPGALIADAARAMRQAEGDWLIEIIDGSERELQAYLARGRIDIALSLVGRGHRRFSEEPIFEEGYSLALTSGHPLVHETMIAAEALADNIMIVRRHCEALAETSRHFTERGVRPHFAYRSTNDERVAQMVSAGVGITIMPDCFAWPGMSRRPLLDFGARRTIGLILGKPHDKLPQAILDCCRALRPDGAGRTWRDTSAKA